MHEYGRRSRPGCMVFDNPELERSAGYVSANSMAAMLPVFAKIEDWMRLLGYQRRDLVAVAMALREAVLNAIRHGHRNDPGKFLHVKYLVTDTEVILEVQDEGFGFTAESVPDALAAWADHQPRGRGLFLMRAYASWLSFNATGNRVTLCRYRSKL